MYFYKITMLLSAPFVAQIRYLDSSTCYCMQLNSLCALPYVSKGGGADPKPPEGFKIGGKGFWRFINKKGNKTQNIVSPCDLENLAPSEF